MDNAVELQVVVPEMGPRQTHSNELQPQIDAHGDIFLRVIRLHIIYLHVMYVHVADKQFFPERNQAKETLSLGACRSRCGPLEHW